MAQRRCLQTLTRQAIAAALSSNPTPLYHALESPLHSLFTKTPISRSLIFTNTTCHNYHHHAFWSHHNHNNRRYFSLNSGDESENDAAEDDEEEEEEDDSHDDVAIGSDLKRKVKYASADEEAAAIGYEVIGPLEEKERVIKSYEPVFAVVQVGSHQFKVSNGDCIFTERLKFCDINDKLVLNKVLLLGSKTQTIVGRPMVPDALVHAIVEEHALDAKVIIFKKKRRKNYRRTKGHRQELTKLRITDIQGIEKPETSVDVKPRRAEVRKQEKVPVAA